MAIVPIGLCYPGCDPAGGDKPPRRECAPLWQARLLEHLRDVRLTLLVGYAQRFHLRSAGKATMTETVRSFRQYAPQFMPLPSPELAQHGVDAAKPVVRGKGAARAAANRVHRPRGMIDRQHSRRSIAGVTPASRVRRRW